MADAKKELSKVMMSLYIIIAIFAVCIAWAIYEAAVLGDFIMMIPGLVIGFMTLVFGVPLVWLRNSERRINLRLAVIALQSERTAFSILAGSGDADVDRTARSALNRLKSIPGLSATFLEHFPEIALLMEPTQGE